MKDEQESEKISVDFNEAAMESFVARMESEGDERSDIKFEIAAFVIHELSHNTPSWFKSYFLSNMAKDHNRAYIADEKIFEVENAFYDGVADFLINMESEVDYVKKLLAPVAEERDKREFWQPIVADAFFIVGIYFSTFMKSSIHDNNRIKGRQTGRNISLRYLYHSLMPTSVL